MQKKNTRQSKALARTAEQKAYRSAAASFFGKIRICSGEVPQAVDLLPRGIVVFSSALLFVYFVSDDYLRAAPPSQHGSIVELFLGLSYSATGSIFVYNLPYYAYSATPHAFSFLYFLLPAALVLREFLVCKRSALFMLLAMLLLSDLFKPPFTSLLKAYVVLLLFFGYGALCRSNLPYAAGSYLLLRIRQIKKSRLILLLLLVTFSLRFFYIIDDSSLRSFSEGNAAYAAFRIFKGELPYRDFIYTHLPLAPFLLASFYKLFGAGLLQAKLLTAFVNTLAILPVYWLGKRFYGCDVAFLAATFWAIYPVSLMGGSFVLLDSFMVMFLLASAVLFFRMLSPFLAGIFLGIATLCKESAVLMVLPFFVYLYRTGRLKRVSSLICGFLIPLLLVPFFYSFGPANFSFILDFHKSIPPHTFQEKAATVWGELYLGNVSILAVFVVGLFAAIRTKTAGSLFVSSWFFTLLFFFLNRVFWWKYVLQVLPAVVLLMSLGLVCLLRSLRKKKSVYWRGTTVCFFTLMLLFFAVRDVGFLLSGNMDGMKAATVLREVTKPGDYVISPMLQIPLLADRKVPGALEEFGVQNTLLESSTAIGVSERFNVTAVVMDVRILSAGQLAGFREYVYSTFHPVYMPNLKERNVSIWVRETAEN